MHNRFLSVARAFVLAAITIGPAVATLAELPPLIPRETLFGNPERVSPRLSPDGKRLAWLAPDKKNVLQVWVKTIGKDDDKVITADKKRGIRQYFWAEDNKTLVYLQDNDGDETDHAFGIVLYPDEGHGFARPENRIDFNARAEKFLAECLGGRFEPMTGDRIPGSTAVVKTIRN